MDKKEQAKHRTQLVKSARKMGIDNPERFRVDELEALLNSLPTSMTPEPLNLPSSSSLVSPVPGPAAPTEDVAELLATADVPDEQKSHGDPFYVEPPPVLPAPLGKDGIWLIPVDPWLVFAVWDVAPSTMKRVQESRAPTTLRLESPDIFGHVDHEVHLGAMGWYLKPPGDRVRLTASLGTGRGNDFQPFIRSKVISVPPSIPSPSQTTFRVSVPYDLDRRLVPQESVKSWIQGEPVAAQPSISVQRAESAAEVALRVRRAAAEKQSGLVHDRQSPEGIVYEEETTLAGLPSSAALADARKRKKRTALPQPPSGPSLPSSRQSGRRA